MTALKEYQRLECTGLWREAPGAQRRDVIVSFGDATLVISDARNNRALAHWSLPAVQRVNPGRKPAIYSPGEDAGEELEIEDEAMIAAVGKVHALIEARRPHPGRLRSLMLGTALVAVVGFGLLWMPRAIVEHTASALPMAKRVEIGRMALADLVRLSGPPCTAAEGREALKRLRDRITTPATELVVVPDGLDHAVHLPGDLIVIPRRYVAEQPEPDALAGTILAEELRRQSNDPAVGILRHAGLRATIRLLTTGEMSAAALSGYGEELLSTPPAPIAEADLLARFGAAGLPVGPYLRLVGQTGGDTSADGPAIEPVLSDTDWVALQGICDS